MLPGIVLSKLGQPQPESNLALLSKIRLPQAAQVNVPSAVV